jgi:hypothetical protein
MHQAMLAPRVLAVAVLEGTGTLLISGSHRRPKSRVSRLSRHRWAGGSCRARSATASWWSWTTTPHGRS